MSRRQFSPPEREGIWVAHDEVCWLCKRPVGFTEMHIEHLIPVDLKNDPDALIELKRKLGLPPDFEIKSFENWRPAHSDCNLRKSGIATDAPFVGIEIERGRARAAKANELAKEIRSSALLSRAVAKVASACFHDQLTPNQIDYLTDAIPEFSTSPSWLNAHRSDNATKSTLVSDTWSTTEDCEWSNNLTASVSARPGQRLPFTCAAQAVATHTLIELHRCTLCRTMGGRTRCGAARGTRTPDPIITNDVLYQLSYCGVARPWPMQG